MKLITFKTTNSDIKERYRIGGLIGPDEVADITHVASKEALTATELLGCFDLDRGFVENARRALESGTSQPTLKRQDIKIVSPVPRPGKIICIGLNYRDHAEESGMAIPTSPVIFSKFSTCAIGPNQPIVIPEGSTQTDYEAELAFVIGRHAQNIKKENALDHVLGYTNFNDVSARDFQFADGQWQRGKSCDTFAPMGEFIATADEIPDPQDLSIKLHLNGETLQDSNTNQMIFGVAELIEFLSRFITLEPGDVVATGTPPGVGFARKPPVYLKNGDTVEVEIEGLGVLSNPVIKR
ncbi:MAG TPA: fumarylacetoacetate hydrolase family protein [Pyrinomonadaceae bacterium]|nr:fumarylacetoacetate hydrolase family protein [Pyrinomonadaceae bacterium]